MAAGLCDIQYGPDRRPWRETLSEMAVTKDGELLVSPPTSDPLQLDSYPEVPGLTSAWYQIPSSGQSPEQRQRALEETSALVHRIASQVVGFQGLERFDYPILKKYSNVHLNNEGDPFNQPWPSTAGDTKWLERNILDYFASLWHAKWPHDPSDPESYWGYIAGIGSTEGNMFAVLSARDYLSGMFLIPNGKEGEGYQSFPSYAQGRCAGDNPNALKPVGFFSGDSHFNVAKSFQVCDVPTFHDLGTQLYPNESPLGGEWPHDVPCEDGDAGPGSIDISALAKLVDFFSGKGHPIIVMFNYGSTFKGAYDDVKGAEDALLPILKKNGMYERNIYSPEDPSTPVTRKGFWFHVDGALAAAYMPFIEIGHKQGLIKDAPEPVFDFRLESVASIVTSMAKWFGGPWPSGIYLTRTGLQVPLRSGGNCHCVSEPTFSCSRNGHTSIVMWTHISSLSLEDQIKKVSKSLRVTDYAERQLRALQEELQTDLWVSRTRLSLAVYFKMTNKEIFEKYSLTAKSLYFNGELRQYCHIYVMDHVEREHIDNLITELRQPGAFPTQNPAEAARKMLGDIP